MGQEAAKDLPLVEQPVKTRKKLTNKPLQRKTDCVNVMMMDGQSQNMPVRSGATAQKLGDEILVDRGQPFHTIKFMEGTRLLDNDECMSIFVGNSLTAVISKLPRSDGAKKLLRRCFGAGSLNIEHKEMIEVKFPLTVDDMVPLLELICDLEPSRLLIGTPPLYDHDSSSHVKTSLTPGCLAKLTSSLRCSLPSLREVALYPTSAEDALHVARLLQWCPNLQQCDLTGTSMTVDDVRSLRHENMAKIII